MAEIDVYNFFPAPCIQFEMTVYEVLEGDTADKPVEVCVITCSDIGDSAIKAYVFADEDVPLPPGAARASKLPNCTGMYMYIYMCLSKHQTAVHNNPSTRG